MVIKNHLYNFLSFIDRTFILLLFNALFLFNAPFLIIDLYENIINNKWDVSSTLILIFIIFYCFFLYVKHRFDRGHIKFDRSVYKVYNVGDEVTVTKNFIFDIFLKAKYRSYNFINGTPPTLIRLKKFNKDEKYKVSDVVTTHNGWIIKISDVDYPSGIREYYLHFSLMKKHFRTHKEMRINKLDKLNL